ncbi:MAG: hypothetical protein QY318_01630 [Candidatus Dojkabacteria bacterium]|nr:MAG: hypothetical protein QY318_01630 [Candidatus Dojkabacteria bacterium]
MEYHEINQSQYSEIDTKLANAFGEERSFYQRMPSPESTTFHKAFRCTQEQQEVGILTLWSRAVHDKVLYFNMLLFDSGSTNQLEPILNKAFEISHERSLPLQAGHDVSHEQYLNFLSDNGFKVVMKTYEGTVGLHYSFVTKDVSLPERVVATKLEALDKAAAAELSDLALQKYADCHPHNPVVGSIYKEYWDRDMSSEAINKQLSLCFKLEGKIIGYIILEESDGDGELFLLDFWLAPATTEQSQTYVEYAMSAMMNAGYEKLSFEADSTDENLMRLLNLAGYPLDESQAFLTLQS